MANSQWLMATSSISIPNSSAASTRPWEVPPAPQNRLTQIIFRKDSWILIRADQTEEGGIEEQDLNVAKSKVSAQPNTLWASFAAVVSDVIWLKSRQFVLCEGVALN
jgi:hypothetical protein